MIEFLKTLWQKRICNKLTLLGLILIYLGVFHHAVINQFLQFIFLNVGEKVITSTVNAVISSPQFTPLVISGLGALLVYMKAKK